MFAKVVSVAPVLGAQTLQQKRVATRLELPELVGRTLRSLSHKRTLDQIVQGFQGFASGEVLQSVSVRQR